jgi:hypothetical protein
MVARGILAPVRVHFGLYRVAHCHRALIDDSTLHNQPCDRAMRILNDYETIRATDLAAVAQLTATLGVKGRMGQHHFDWLTLRGVAHRNAIHHKGSDH